jgi:predicted nucleic acid-binding Zn ribbon protein
MSDHTPWPLDRLKPAPAASHLGADGAPALSCTVCGGPRAPERRAACSSRCRAALSRRRTAEAQRRRDAEILAVLDGIERLCRILTARLQSTT